jgi:SAM-dependent methyltransferase
MLMAIARAAARFVLRRYDRWVDASLDRKYGIDTCGVDEAIAYPNVPDALRTEFYAYEAIQVPMFRALMRTLDIEPRGYVFVDFGSGKGRALVLAAEHGFRRIIGVELAPALHEAATRNIEIFRSRRSLAAPIELYRADAVDLLIPDSDAFLFFYNPFGESVMRRVAQNIERSFREHPRSLVVAYRNPIHSFVFDELAFLQSVLGNKSFAVYRTA